MKTRNSARADGINAERPFKKCSGKQKIWIDSHPVFKSVGGKGPQVQQHLRQPALSPEGSVEKEKLKMRRSWRRKAKE